MESNETTILVGNNGLCTWGYALSYNLVQYPLHIISKVHLAYTSICIIGYMMGSVVV